MKQKVNPDNKPLSESRRIQTPKLTIPKFAKARLEFSAKTKSNFVIHIFDSENEIVVKKDNNSINIAEIMERDRTKDRPLTIYAWDKRPFNIQQYVIQDWYQLTGRLVMNSGDNNSSGTIEFEDQLNANDRDFDDIRIKFTFS